MRSLILTIFLALTAECAVNAQITAKSAFTTAPPEIIISLPESIRLDMIDYFESGSDRPSKSLFGTDARITRLDSDLGQITVGDIQRLDFAILLQKNGEIIMVINRLATPDTDSDIRFYNSKWVELDKSKIFSAPKFADWVGNVDKSTREDLENALPFIMYDATYDPDSHTLTLTPQTEGYVAQESREIVDQYLRPSITYKWDGKKFIMLKQ